MRSHEDVKKDSKEEKCIGALTCHLKTPRGSSLPKSFVQMVFQESKGPYLMKEIHPFLQQGRALWEKGCLAVMSWPKVL